MMSSQKLLIQGPEPRPCLCGRSFFTYKKIYMFVIREEKGSLIKLCGVKKEHAHFTPYWPTPPRSTDTRDVSQANPQAAHKQTQGPRGTDVSQAASNRPTVP